MSKVLVAIKRVIDYNARVRVKPDKASRTTAQASGTPTAMQLNAHNSTSRYCSLVQTLPLTTAVCSDNADWG